MHTDPIADLLTRLRNASNARHESTTVSASKMKRAILEVMKKKGVIRDFQELDTEASVKVLSIRLDPERSLELTRVSKPGQRIYKKSEDIERVRRGYGFSILSTSSGIMTGDEARKKGVGGEILCEVF